MTSADPAQPASGTPEPDSLEARAWQRWGRHGWQWREWLRRSPRAIALFDWLNESDKYRVMVGDDGYRERVLDLLSQAVPDDCAAAGMQRDGANASVYSDILEVLVQFSPAARHRAVLWRDAQWPAALLWIDGVAATLDAAEDGPYIDTVGWWVDERFYCVRAPGPRSHPQQNFAGFDLYLGEIQSLLVWDAERQRRHSLQSPEASQAWTRPHAVARDGSLRMYADDRRRADDRPDRIVALEPPTLR